MTDDLEIMPDASTVFYGKLPRWVIQSDVTDGAKVLYALLADLGQRVDPGSHRPLVQVGRSRLAHLLGVSDPKTITRRIAELEGIEAVKPYRSETKAADGQYETNRYYVCEQPPERLRHLNWLKGGRGADAPRGAGAPSPTDAPTSEGGGSTTSAPRGRGTDAPRGKGTGAPRGRGVDAPLLERPGDVGDQETEKSPPSRDRVTRVGADSQFFARDKRRPREAGKGPYLTTMRHSAWGDHFRSPSGLNYPALPYSGCTEAGAPIRADRTVRDDWAVWRSEHKAVIPRRITEAERWLSNVGTVDRVKLAYEGAQEGKLDDWVWFRSEVDPAVAAEFPSFASCRIGLRDLAILLAPWCPIEHTVAARIATAGMVDEAAQTRVARWIGAQRVANLAAVAMMDDPLGWLDSLPAPDAPDWPFEVERARAALAVAAETVEGSTLRMLTYRLGDVEEALGLQVAA